MEIVPRMLTKATLDNLIRLAKFLTVDYDCDRNTLERRIYSHILCNPTPHIKCWRNNNMDPSVNLSEQIMICYNVINGKPVDVDRLAELVLNLHEWMRKGGALPKQWEQPKK